VRFVVDSSAVLAVRQAEPACLNFGDLFAYALARRLNLPLLFKGEDFAQTDIRAMPWRSG
jgi:ribonuclease VapC